jgi:hypothetical protein
VPHPYRVEHAGSIVTTPAGDEVQRLKSILGR